jgi:hypothetical protein
MHLYATLMGKLDDGSQGIERIRDSGISLRSRREIAFIVCVSSSANLNKKNIETKRIGQIDHLLDTLGITDTVPYYPQSADFTSRISRYRHDRF